MDSATSENVEKGWKFCQDLLRSNPVLVVGSGASAPYGMPSMTELGEHIVTSVETANVGSDNRTVLSQCNNMVAMRLTNTEDQNRIKALLPDSLGGFSDLLPILDTGEAIVVGDASLLPSRIRVARPQHEPRSATVPFWEEWAKAEPSGGIQSAVESWRRQSIHE